MEKKSLGVINEKNDFGHELPALNRKEITWATNEKHDSRS